MSLQNAHHMPNPRNVLGSSNLKPTNTKAKLASAERSRFFQVLAEPLSQRIEFVCVRTRDGFPFDGTRYSLEDSLFNMAVLVFATNHESDILTPLYRIVALKDKTFVFGLNKCESPWDARQNCAHSTADNLLQCIDEQDLFLIERRVLGNGKNYLRGPSLVQLSSYVVNEKFVAGDWKPVLRVEILEVSELASEFMT